jgi:hypothetical protein
MTAIGDKKTNRRHLQIAERWVVQYNFYVNDPGWGRMFVRMCPYLPFSARVSLPSMLIVIPCRCKVPVKSSLVN